MRQNASISSGDPHSKVRVRHTQYAIIQVAQLMIISVISVDTMAGTAAIRILSVSESIPCFEYSAVSGKILANTLALNRNKYYRDLSTKAYFITLSV